MELSVSSLDPKAVDGRHATPPSGPLAWQTFYSFRNRVLEVLRPFGSVGPMGPTPIVEGSEYPPGQWKVEAENPDYFVVDDRWFDEQMFVRVELSPRVMTASLLEAVVEMLQDYPGWGVGFALYYNHRMRGYLLVLRDRIMKQGRLFWLRRTIPQILTTCQKCH